MQKVLVEYLKALFEKNEKKDPSLVINIFIGC